MQQNISRNKLTHVCGRTVPSLFTNPSQTIGLDLHRAAFRPIYIKHLSSGDQGNNHGQEHIGWLAIKKYS